MDTWTLAWVFLGGVGMGMTLVAGTAIVLARIAPKTPYPPGSCLVCGKPPGGGKDSNLPPPDREPGRKKHRTMWD